MTYSKTRITLAFLAAVVSAFTCASIAHTQFVLHELSAIGVEISLATRLTTTAADLLGLSSGYGPIVLIGLLIGFSIIGLLRRFFNWSAPLSFAIAGALSLAAIHLLMFPIFYITLIAGARGLLGFSFQCAAGLIGGLVFARLLYWAKQAD